MKIERACAVVECEFITGFAPKYYALVAACCESNAKFGMCALPAGKKGNDKLGVADGAQLVESNFAHALCAFVTNVTVGCPVVRLFMPVAAQNLGGFTRMLGIYKTCCNIKSHSLSSRLQKTVRGAFDMHNEKTAAIASIFRFKINHC